MPLIPLVAINSSPQPQHRKTIVEASQHENAVQPLRQNKQRENIRRDLSLMISTMLSPVIKAKWVVQTLAFL